MKHYKTGVSKKYYELGGSACGLSKKLFHYYRIETKKMFRLGDRIEFNGETCYISEVEALLKGAELIFTFTLGSKVFILHKNYIKSKINRTDHFRNGFRNKKRNIKIRLASKTG